MHIQRNPQAHVGGRGRAERETDVRHRTELADARSLTYRQVSTASRWKLTKTCVADPERSSVRVDVTFQSRAPLSLHVLAEPALSNTGDDDRGDGMTAWDAKGASDGWTDPRDDHRMDWTYDARDPGNVVQLAATRLDGLERRHLTLAATEDKTYRGALIASPSMPWVWGNIAGYWPNLQLDEVADPILLSWQLGRTDAGTWAHVKAAAGCILANGPKSQERWENADGSSPATIGAEIAGLICAAAIAERNGDADSARRYRDTADEWRRSIPRSTVTTTGTLSPDPYFLRLTVDGNADAGTTYMIGDGGPTLDQRAVVDPSFLELVRLGVLPAGTPAVRNTLPVVDREHELLAGDPAAAAKRLQATAATANAGGMLPEQVWDDHPPAGQPGFEPGTGTFSATPLGWTHAQLIRLAWSLDAGRPVEQPQIVADRYR